MASRFLRLHPPEGGVIIEPLVRTAKTNGLAGVEEARRLVAHWVAMGDLHERGDGGYDIVHLRPRPDHQRVAEMRQARGA